LRPSRPLGALVMLMWPAVASAAPATPHPGAAAPAPRGVHLSWVRDATAAGCPNAAAIEAQVVARLGEDPFALPPGQFIEALVAHPADAFQVTIAMRGLDGRLIGNRTLSSGARDCASIATAAALTIAILIDPEAIASVPPAPPPPPPVAPRAPPPAGRPGRVTAAAAGGWGLLPRAALGLGLGATVDVAPRLAVGVTAAFFPERRTTPPDDGFGFGLTAGTLVGCWVPRDAEAARWRFELCAGAEVGVLHAVVYEDQPTGPGQRWYVGATELTRVVVRLPGALVAEVALDATQPFPRRAFFVEGRPTGMDTVFTQPLASVTGWAGLGLRWR
jgi:hypothetical protein